MSGDAAGDETERQKNLNALREEIKHLVNKYASDQGLTHKALAKRLEMQGTHLEYRLNVIRGGRESHNEYAKLTELHFVRNKMIRIIPPLKSYEATLSENAAVIDSGNTKSSVLDDFGFVIAKAESANFDADAKKFYEGLWFGVCGSTFRPGSLVVFDLELSSHAFGFKSKFSQMGLNGVLTDYPGVAYFMHRQLWVFLEEQNKQEFTCLSLQTPSGAMSSTWKGAYVNWMPGVFMGRGGDRPRNSHSAAGKACVVRSAGEDSELHRQLRDIIREDGWVKPDDLKELFHENATVSRLISYATPRVDNNDLVLRAETTILPNT